MRSSTRWTTVVTAAAVALLGFTTAPAQAAVEQQPTDLLAPRSGVLGEPFDVGSGSQPCPAGSTDAQLRLNAGGNLFLNEVVDVWVDGSWRLEAVIPEDVQGRSLYLQATCSAGLNRSKDYVLQRFEIKNGAFWWQPSDYDQAFVVRTYEDLFLRQPDAGGLRTWTDAIKAGTPRTAVANGITSSYEYRSGLVADSYRYYLEREPDRGGLDGWVRELNRGTTIEHIEAGLMASPEYYQRFSGNTLEGWVRRMYSDVLERNASSTEVTYWANEIRSGRKTRYTAAMGFLRSTENLRVVVQDAYEYLLDRPADTAGRDEWVRRIQRGLRQEQLVAGVTASREYWLWGQG